LQTPQLVTVALSSGEYVRDYGEDWVLRDLKGLAVEEVRAIRDEVKTRI